VSSLAAARTDVVGSLLRPARWKEARLRLDSGLMDRESFAALEVDCVKKNLELQEDAGLDVVTDGEISRLNFQDSFGLSVSGYDSGRGESIGSQENRSRGGTPLSRWEIPDLAGPGTPVIHRRPVRQRLQLTRNVPLEEYLRVAPLAKRPVKVTLIGPDRVAQRVQREVAYVVAVHEHPAFGHLVEPRQQIDNGRLAAAGGPEQRNCLPWLDLQ